jgi:hypothetical protein
MALPADEVAEPGGDRLVGDEVLQEERRRPQHQEDEPHEEELHPVVAEQAAGRMARDQRHDAADEDRNGRVERRHREAGEKEQRDQAARLPRIVPVEGEQPGGRRRLRRQRGRLEQTLEETEWRHRLCSCRRRGRHRHSRVVTLTFGTPFCAVIASAAKQSPTSKSMPPAGDCFVGLMASSQ